MKIKTKLTISHLSMAILPVLAIALVLGWIVSQELNELDYVAHEQGVEVLVAQANDALKQSLEAKLLAVQAIKQKAIEDYFQAMMSQLHVAKDNPYTVEAKDKFDEAFMNHGASIDSDDWRALAQKYDPFYKDMCTDNGWYDVFLMCPEGYIVYTMTKESDLGLSLNREPLKSSGLGEAFRKLQETKSLEIATSDFKPYAPSNGEQTAFMMARLSNESGAVTGYIAFQISSSAINHIVQQRTGLGQTGESYLVGKDADGNFSLRSDRVVKEGKIGEAKKGKFLSMAIAGETGIGHKTGSTGDKEIVAYTSLKIDGLNWGMITSQLEQEALAAVAAMNAKSEDIGEKIETTREESIRSVVTLTVVACGIIFVLGFCLTVLIARGITTPIQRVVDFAQLLRVGDLSQRLPTGKDEPGLMALALNNVVEELSVKAKAAAMIAGGDLMQTITVASEKDELGKALQTMIKSLKTIVGELQASVAQIDAGSRQVSDSSQSLSQGATEQAASLQEITSSMDNIGYQTKTNAENSAQANQFAQATSESSNRGTKQMQNMMAAMGAISESSKEIEKIIKAIDDIAFQTNLLALNAAVEAARAGKHGKGFAVVAQEVRTLAARSAKAAQETSDLIENSIKQVERGNSVAEDTAKALAEINEGITRVNDLVDKIAAASNEQAQGISQINQGLSQIDGVTQQNTANAEETASAAQELSSQAAQVRELIAVFKLRKGASPADAAQDTNSADSYLPMPSSQ